MHHQRTLPHLSLLIADCFNRGHFHLVLTLPYSHSNIPLCPIPLPYNPSNLPLIPPWIPYYYPDYHYLLPITTKGYIYSQASCMLQ